MSGPPTLDVYVPLHQIHPDGAAFLRNNQFWMVRTDGDPAAFAQTFAGEVQNLDRDVAISSTGTMRRYLDAWFAPLRFSLALVMAFSLSAVLLAVTGLYGLVAYAISRRQREFAIRIALGATAETIHRSLLLQAGRLAAWGMALGLFIAIAARAVAPAVAEETPVGALTVAVAMGSLLAAAMLAAWIPARRAVRSQPIAALRAE
jgi:putative ABC transport system permease protein